MTRITEREYEAFANSKMSAILRKLDVGQKFALWYCNHGVSGDTDLFQKSAKALKHLMRGYSIVSDDPKYAPEDIAEDINDTRFTFRAVLILEIKNGDVLVVDSKDYGWNEVSVTRFDEWRKNGGKSERKDS